MRSVLIVFELAPRTLRKLKDDNKTREIQKFTEWGLSRMAQVPEGEGCFIYILLTAMHLQEKHHLFNGVVMRNTKDSKRKKKKRRQKLKTTDHIYTK